jgi:citrate/tricarballylate utilization protein
MPADNQVIEGGHDPVAEGERIMRICNACRYCEGYCAVFPAMERRLQFTRSDLNYLANLCHNCGECYYACQYSPPHEFNVSVPKNFAEIRARSYRQYAWPAPLAAMFERNGLAVSLVMVLILALAMAVAALVLGDGLVAAPADPAGDFYRYMPHEVMAGLFGGVSVFVALALVMGFLRFWRDMGESLAEFARPDALWSALKNVLKLEYLDGKGAGCTYPGEERSQARRWFHHLSFYGFALCFAATVTGTLYHYAFGWKAPYGYLSLPVILGTLGGIALLIGPAGLLWLKGRRDPETGDATQMGMDVAFIVLLFATSLTGLALLAFRETSACGLLLVIHLAVVMALFLTLPYGKFVHGIYRSAALVRYALEKSRPMPSVGFD